MNPFTFLPPGSNSLREPSREIEAARITTPEFQAFLDRLIVTMHAADGVGVAAPQIGENIQAIVVNLPSGPECFINPEITHASPTLLESEEGCLSVPGVYGIVMRHKKVRVKALNRHGRRVELEVKQFSSFVFQHEIDHLKGILFIDKTVRITKQ